MTPALGNGAVQCGRFAAVALGYDADAVAVTTQHGGRIVGGAVIDDQDLEVSLIESEPAEPAHDALDPVLLVVGRDDDRGPGVRRAWLCACALCQRALAGVCHGLGHWKTLPPALADALLRKLLADGDWHRGTWTVGGKTSVNARRTRSFRIRMTGGGEFEALGGGADAQAREENGSSRARGYAACPELLEAARFVTAAAREVAPRSWKDDWEPTVAFGNRYDGGQEHVGYHSDFLMTMGPRPIIAGLSLGATREFRLRREGTDYAPSRVVCMPAEHNSLIVMSRDCQEEWSVPGVLRRAFTRVAAMAWGQTAHTLHRRGPSLHRRFPRRKHSVAKTSSVPFHAVAGETRFSLTFRRNRPEFSQSATRNCNCGKPAALKCAKGRYYYTCCMAGGDASQKCSYYARSAVAQQEADRLRAIDESG